MEDCDGKGVAEAPELPLEVSHCWRTTLTRTGAACGTTVTALVDDHASPPSTVPVKLHMALIHNTVISVQIKWFCHGFFSSISIYIYTVYITFTQSNAVFLSLAVDHSLHPELSPCLRQKGSFSGLPQMVQCQSGPAVSGKFLQSRNPLRIVIHLHIEMTEEAGASLKVDLRTVSLSCRRTSPSASQLQPHPWS